jgi:type VI protein secretion system component VasF
MSNLPEIKKRLDRLNQLGNRLREQLKKFSGPEGEAIKKRAKKGGTKVGVGAGISFLGFLLAAVASLYVLAVIIFAVDVALNRLWLSSLIVVGGFLIIGGGIVALGIVVAKPGTKDLSQAKEDATKELKQTGEEMKAELDELQKAAKREAEERQKQIVAAAPYALAGAVVLKLVHRSLKKRKQRRAILKVIDMYEERKAEE